MLLGWLPALLGALWLRALSTGGGPRVTVHYWAGARQVTAHLPALSLDALFTVLFNATDVSPVELLVVGLWWGLAHLLAWALLLGGVVMGVVVLVRTLARARRDAPAR